MWTVQSRVVAEPTGAKVTGSRAAGGALVHFDVSFRTVEWPWKEAGPVSLILQPSEVRTRVKSGTELALGFALPDSKRVMVPASHSSTDGIRYSLFLPLSALTTLERARNGGKLEVVMELAALPLFTTEHAGYAPGFDVRATSSSYSFPVTGDQWLEVLQSVDYADEQTTVEALEARVRALGEEVAARHQQAEALILSLQDGAAQKGVSQQAIYFREEADEHKLAAERWLKLAKWLTFGLASYAGVTLFLHKLPWISPNTPAEAIQFGIGKVLVFATIAYFLILSARNYMAHRHNAIVNKHRQNSLVSYRALVEAAGDNANRDIVLTKAAESIFGAQTTGFTKHDGDDGKALSMVNVGASVLKNTSSG